METANLRDRDDCYWGNSEAVHISDTGCSEIDRRRLCSYDGRSMGAYFPIRISKYICRPRSGSKVALVRSWNRSRQRILFVGDGMNDAGAMAISDVAIV